MKQLIINVPDTFTDDQILFIKKSAANQIEAEMLASLTAPQNDIDATRAAVDAMFIANELPAKNQPIVE